MKRPSACRSSSLIQGDLNKKFHLSLHSKVSKKSRGSKPNINTNSKLSNKRIYTKCFCLDSKNEDLNCRCSYFNQFDPNIFNINNTNDYLSLFEWKDKEEKALRRPIQSQNCSICHEYFCTSKNQVILSCSHIFHLACICSFEAFVGLENRFCPVCREAKYERKSTSIGLEARKDTALSSIIASARGWMTRKKYRSLLRENYKGKREQGQYHQHSINNFEVSRETKFYTEELEIFGDKVCREIESNEELIDDMVRSMDLSVQKSRTLFQAFEDKGGISSEWRDRPNYRWDTQWDSVLRVALERREKGGAECPICMCPMKYRYDQCEIAKIVVNDCKDDVDICHIDSDVGSSKLKVLSLLSCSHMFHAKCIHALESFNALGSRMTSICPVCRSTYKKMCIVP